MDTSCYWLDYLHICRLLLSEEDEQDAAPGEDPNDPTAMAKISALELELSQLRAQLAQVIKHQESSAEHLPPRKSIISLL